MKKQLSLFKEKQIKHHGGSYSVGKRKTSRPFVAARPMHLVLRSSQAKGSLSLIRQRAPIAKIVENTAKKFGVVLMGYTNAGNHLHLVVRSSSNRYLSGKSQVSNFMRVIAGTIALKITRTNKSKPLEKRFWDYLAFSRVMTWGRELEKLEVYLTKNFAETNTPWRREVDPETKFLLAAMETFG